MAAPDPGSNIESVVAKIENVTGGAQLSIKDNSLLVKAATTLNNFLVATIICNFENGIRTIRMEVTDLIDIADHVCQMLLVVREGLLMLLKDVSISSNFEARLKEFINFFKEAKAVAVNVRSTLTGMQVIGGITKSYEVQIMKLKQKESELKQSIEEALRFDILLTSSQTLVMLCNTSQYIIDKMALLHESVENFRNVLDSSSMQCQELKIQFKKITQQLDTMQTEREDAEEKQKAKVEVIRNQLKAVNNGRDVANAAIMDVVTRAEATEAEARKAEAATEAAIAQAKIVEADAKDTKAEAEHAKAETEDTKAEAEDTKAEAENAKAEAEDAKAAMMDVVARAQSAEAAVDAVKEFYGFAAVNILVFMYLAVKYFN
ncbi:hypothetical protein BDQ17DRAFT_1335580 [Cyathus striatus]|nr:hypothetical protein BDQ17DRAFT_1335580 [Cyathus striatus]